MNNYNILIAFAIMVGIMTIGYLYITFIAPKFQKKDTDTFKLMLGVVKYFANNYTFKYDIELEKAVEYCLTGISVLEKLDSVKSMVERIRIAKEETYAICYDNKVDLSDEDKMLIDTIVEFVVENYI